VAAANACPNSNTRCAINWKKCCGSRSIQERLYPKNCTYVSPEST
jgi:hypothetical protein